MRRALAGVAALLLCGHASAFYASPTFPERWGGSPGAWTFNPPSGWSGGAAGGSVSQTIGGRSINIPFSARMAGNAGAAVASAIRITPGGIITAAVASWLITEGIGWLADHWAVQETTTPGASIYYWQGATGGAACRQSAPGESLARCSLKLQHNIQDSALRDCAKTGGTATSETWRCFYVPNGNALNTSMSRVTACTAPAVWWQGACVSPGTTYREATENDWDKFANKPVPDQVANDVGTAIPVELPTLNPDAQGQPQPQRVPVGNPQPVAGTSPQEYRQPVVDLVPAPAAGDPFRLDVQPKEVSGTDPQGQTDPAPVPTENPPAAGSPDQIQLCEAYPDIAACKPLGTPEADEPLPTQNVPLQITPFGGFGPSTAACPAPRQTVLASGFVVSMPYDLICTFVDGLRPLIVAFAWVASVFAFLGIARKGD